MKLSLLRRDTQSDALCFGVGPIFFREKKTGAGSTRGGVGSCKPNL